jgi:hypothetical protein
MPAILLLRGRGSRILILRTAPAKSSKSLSKTHTHTHTPLKNNEGDRVVEHLSSMHKALGLIPGIIIELKRITDLILPNIIPQPPHFPQSKRKTKAKLFQLWFNTMVPWRS